METLFKPNIWRYSFILLRVMAIILTTVLTTRMTINRLISNDGKMNELNAQLMQSDKLAALETAGVAHEINNPLAVILQKTGWMEDLLLEEDFQSSSNLEEFKVSIRKIEEHVERARKVVHNMLGYARRWSPIWRMWTSIIPSIRRSVCLKTMQETTISISRPIFGLPIIASDQAQLQQVFLNLISNAIDAIGKDGLIEITSRISGRAAYRQHQR